MLEEPTGRRTTNVPANLRPESQLILCCARARMDVQTAERIRVLLLQEIDWELLIRTALPQRVLPLIYVSLNGTSPERVPKPVLKALQARFEANAVRNLTLTSELLRLLDLFQARGIPAIPFKGPSLAAFAYRNIALREFGDLDILVHPWDVPRAKDLVVFAGYRSQRYPAEWECHFATEQGPWLVDLHQRITSPYFPAPATFEQLCAGLVPVSVGSRTMLTLGPEDLLLTLSVQFVSDCWGWGQRLVQVCDTAELIRAHPEMKWELVFGKARQVGARRVLLLTLCLANRLLDAKLPHDVLRTVQLDPVVQGLAAEVQARLLPEAEGPPKAIQFRWNTVYQDSAFYLRVRERLTDKLRYLGLRIRLLLVPTPRDRDSIALPSSLAFLYYVVRPIRLLTRLVRTGSLRTPKVSPTGHFIGTE